MPSEVMEKWNKSKRSAHINSLSLRPVKHPICPGIPLSVQCGQAEAYWLRASDKSEWIIKKFKAQQCPARPYLDTIASLLPKSKPFSAGADRIVLTSDSLVKNNGSYHTQAFSQWLVNVIFMPKIPGSDWASVADMLRSKKLLLNLNRRITLCRNLAQVVSIMEKHGLSHRDLSIGNVFINLKTLEVLLIDFDSCFHPHLIMPQVTTFGSEGYTPGYIWQNGNPDPKMTWCPHADRFPLTILNVEFLLLDEQTPLTGDGGIFDQQELCLGSGTGLDRITEKLKNTFPAAVDLLGRAIKSKGCKECPAPEEWMRICDGFTSVAKVISLSDLEEVNHRYFTSILNGQMPNRTVPSVPRLSDLPQGFQIPKNIQAITPTKNNRQNRKPIPKPINNNPVKGIHLLKIKSRYEQFKERTAYIRQDLAGMWDRLVRLSPFPQRTLIVCILIMEITILISLLITFKVR